MKLMKLLLIGLLSVVALAACSEDEAATTKAAVSIVGADGQAPVLFDNVSAQLKAVDAAGEAIVAPKEVTWGQSSDAAGFAVTSAGIVTVDLSAAIVGTVTLSVKTPGDSTADPVTLDLYDNVTYAPAVSATALTGLAMNSTVATVAKDADITLTAKAVFGATTPATEFPVTASWTATSTNITVTPAGVVTGNVKSAAADNVVTGTFTSNGVTKTVTQTVEVTDAAPAPELASFTIVVKNAAALNVGGTVVEFTITPTVQSGATATPAMSLASNYTCTFGTTSPAVEVSEVGATTCDKLKVVATTGPLTSVVTAKFTAKTSVETNVSVIRLAD